MSPTDLSERVAALEPQVEDLKDEAADFRTFKETMIREIADLTSTVKNLSWRVSMITGAIVVALEQVSQWGFKKFLS